MHRLDQPAARDRQPEAVAQQRGDLAVGQAEAFIEQHGERDRLRPQLHGGGAERVGGLQRMAPLHAPAALRALADVHVEARARAAAAPAALLDIASRSRTRAPRRAQCGHCGGSGAS